MARRLQEHAFAHGEAERVRLDQDKKQQTDKAKERDEETAKKRRFGWNTHGMKELEP